MKNRNRAVPASYLILEQAGKILLGLRQNTGYYDGWYSVPAGHIEAGELPIAGLIRETKEEIGIDIKPEDVKLVHTMYRTKHDETGDRADYFFTASKYTGVIENREPEKCVKLEWFKINKLPDNMMMHHVRHAIDLYQKGVSYSELAFNEKFLNPNLQTE